MSASNPAKVDLSDLPRRAGDDPELAALAVVVASLLALPPEARRRVLEYIGQRFGEDE